MADKKIVDLIPITTLLDTDISEVSDGGGITPSKKETRLQTKQNTTTYINANAQLASTEQVTGLDTALASKLDLHGGTMTGELILAGSPVDPNDATTKNYVDAGLAGKISITGGSISDATGPGPSSNSLFSVSSSVKGSMVLPRFNSTQEATLTGSLSGADTGLGWYNTTLDIPTYWDGADKQQLLPIDNIIQGSNMTITNNGDGTVTFASTGSGGSPTIQVQGAFTVNQSTVFAAPSTSSYTAVAIDGTKFAPIRQVGTSVTTATVDGVTTPIIQNTSAGGTRYCDVTFDLGIGPSSVSGQTYTYCIAIKRSGGSIVLTTFKKNITIPTTSSASGFKPLSLSGIVDLNTNDYAYLTVISDTASQAFSAYYFNAELVDTTIAGIPSTDALSQGSSNLYASRNGGTTFVNVNYPVTSGNLAIFNSSKGDLLDFGFPASALITNVMSMGGDLSGTLPNPTVAKINTVPVSSSSVSDGQVLIGSTSGANYSAATITGTANQVIVTNGSHAITLSTPQSIATSSSPTFAGLNLSGSTASSMVVTDSSKNLASANLPLGVNAIATVNSATQTMALQTRYIVTYASGQVTFSLPAATGSGKTIDVIGTTTASTSGWIVAATSSGKIQFGSSLGAANGSLTSTPGSSIDCATLVDAAPNLWIVNSALGSNLGVS